MVVDQHGVQSLVCDRCVKLGTALGRSACRIHRHSSHDNIYIQLLWCHSSEHIQSGDNVRIHDFKLHSGWTDPCCSVGWKSELDVSNNLRLLLVHSHYFWKRRNRHNFYSISASMWSKMHLDFFSDVV